MAKKSQASVAEVEQPQDESAQIQDVNQEYIAEIPDGRVDFARALNGKGKDVSLADDDEGEIIDVPDEDGAVESVASQTVTADDNDEKEIKKPWARARILEKERNQRDDRIGVLERNLSTLIDRLQQVTGEKQPSGEQAPEIDPDLDPVGALRADIAQMRNELKGLREGTTEAQQQRIVTETLSTVNGRLSSQVQSDPVFQEAVKHVAKIMENTMARKFPGRAESELLQMVQQSANAEKLKWAMDGIDPVDALYGMAMDFGFDPDATEQRLSATQTPHTKTPAAKKTIQQRKEKEAAVASLGNTEGATKKRYAAQDLVGAKTSEEFDRRLNDMLKNGLLTPNPSTPGGTPSFSQLLAGKGRQV